MQAIMVSEFGGPEVLQVRETPLPQARDGEVLVKVLAAGQRGDYQRPVHNCSRVGTITVTILAGPLNYAGVNPNINCTVPQPSS